MTSNLENEKKIIVLAFEGPDKAGKSSLIKALNEVTNYSYLCIDRFIGSAWVYDQLTQRRDRTNEVSQAEQELSTLSTVLIINILVSCDPDILRQRISQQDEFSERRLLELEKALELYELYRQTVSALPRIEVNTSQHSLETTISEILEKIRQYETSHSQKNSRID